MVATIFLITAGLYAAAGTLYLVHLSRGSRRLERWAPWVLGASVAAHVGFLASEYATARRMPTGDIHQTLAVLSLAIAVGYLASMRQHRLTALGAFITPITLLFFLGAGLRSGASAVPPGIHSAILPLHVGANVLGIAAFALAFAVSVGYIIQEQLLRRKKIGGLLQRLPALDVLDGLGLRLVSVGFPLFTLGVVTGSVWAARLQTGMPSFSTSQGLGLLAWACFGGVLLTRVVAGWRGRRAAIGTVLGFVCAVATLAGYLIRYLEGP